MLNRHTGLMATLLGSAGIEHFYHVRKFSWMALLYGSPEDQLNSHPTDKLKECFSKRGPKGQSGEKIFATHYKGLSSLICKELSEINKKKTTQ